MSTDLIDTDSSTDLSTKITVIVFWGLVIIGSSFTGILLHNIKQESIENNEAIADSIAYYVDGIVSENTTSSTMPDQQISESLSSVISRYENIKIELWHDKKLSNYAEHNFNATNTQELY